MRGKSPLTRPDLTLPLILDHLAIVAPSLGEGVAYIRDRLGLEPPEGGRHREMGTRNHLLRLGEAVFLEVIAVDPDAVAPDHPRWFGLDDAAQVRADWEAGRRLRGLVARTDDLEGVLAAHSDLLGEAITVTRGTLAWRFGVRPDGSWPAGGSLPHVMDWGPAGTPAPRMADLGGRLLGLTLIHPDPVAAAAAFAAIGLIDPPEIRRGDVVRYEARIDTPSGSRILT